MRNAELADFIDGVGDRAIAKRQGQAEPCANVAPSGPIEERLAEFWRAALNVECIGADEDFFELGGDSLAGAQIFAAIEQAFGRRIPLSALVQGPTIRHLAAVLSGAVPTSEDDVLVPLRTAGGRPPLFCVHALTGSAVVYRRLAARLGDDQPVYGLQYPGQHLAQPPSLGFADLAARYCQAIRGVQPSGSYHLAGFSLGGVIAYEIAIRLRAAGEEVALLALLDSAAPGHGPPGLARFPRHAREMARRPPWTWPDYLMRRWRNRRARHRNHMILNDGTARGALEARLQRRAKEALRHAWRGYEPGPYDGRVVLFRCAEDIALWRHDPEMGWDALADRGVEVRDIPATHQYLMDEPAVAVLAAELETCLRQVQDSAAGKGVAACRKT